MKIPSTRKLRTKLQDEGLSREERHEEIRRLRRRRARQSLWLRVLLLVGVVGGGFAIAGSSLITNHRSAVLCTVLPIVAVVLFHEPLGLAIRRIGRWFEPEYRRGSWRR